MVRHSHLSVAQTIDEMLTQQQRDEFDAHGFVRLRGVFSKTDAAAMEEHIWNALYRKHDIARDDPSSWDLPLRSELQPLRTHHIFDSMGGPALTAALDDLIGPGRWERPKHWGQFLVSFPVAEGLGLSMSRANWHTDFPYSITSNRVVGALVISFIAEVPRGHGGTLVIAGSHKVVTRFIDARPHLRTAKMKLTRLALLQSDPWLKSLCCASPGEDWTAQLPLTEHAIDGIPVRVVELAGEPGDVVVGHPWLVHSGSPNRGDRPRFMRVQRIRPVLRRAS